MYPSVINLRSYVSEQFFSLRSRALRDSLWGRLIRKCTKLAIFPEQAPRKSPNRQFLGTQDILVEEVTGTLNRQDDFDYKFRPLKKYLVDRWVSVYLALEKSELPPIIVHRVGEHYYVEDGHHRVSVARSQGMAYIRAQVWDYPLYIEPRKQAHSRPRLATNRAKVFAEQQPVEGCC